MCVKTEYLIDLWVLKGQRIQLDQTFNLKLILQSDFNTFLLFVCQDESRIKATVMDVKPVDHSEYSKRLIINIQKLAAQ